MIIIIKWFKKKISANENRIFASTQGEIERKQKTFYRLCAARCTEKKERRKERASATEQWLSSTAFIAHLIFSKETAINSLVESPGREKNNDWFKIGIKMADKYAEMDHKEYAKLVMAPGEQTWPLKMLNFAKGTTFSVVLVLTGISGYVIFLLP